jgi:DNA end-binding protein Ku
VPRAIWSGTVSFGLVSVPVRMFSAVAEHKLHFHYVHEPDGSRIGYEKICKAEGKPVPDDEIVKAFEVEDGEWVYLTDEDFEAAQAEGDHAVEIRDFVKAEEIDPIFFERTYYLAPQDGAERVYALLVRAMEETGLVGVAKLVMRDRQYVAALRVRDGAITLERMHFADEIRDASEHAPAKVKVDKRELEMAVQLVERFEGTFEPEKYEDTYREALMDVIRAKQRGETVAVAPEPEREEPTDLMAALRASIEQAQGGRRGRDGGALNGLSKEELLDLARDAEVPVPVATEVARALVAAGADILSIAESRHSLEDVYLQLTGREKSGE